MRIDPSIVTADAKAIFNSAVETNLLEMERLGMSIKRTSTQEAIIDHYFLTALNKSLRTSRQTNFRLIQALNWSKINFGEIHYPRAGLGFSVSVSLWLLSKLKVEIRKNDCILFRITSNTNFNFD